MELARLEKVHDMPKRHDAVKIWSAVKGHTGSDVLCLRERPLERDARRGPASAACGRSS